MRWGDEISLQGLTAWTFCGSGAPSFAPGQEVDGSQAKEPLRQIQCCYVVRAKDWGLTGAGTLASALQSCPKKTEDFPVPDRPALSQSI